MLAGRVLSANTGLGTHLSQWLVQCGSPWQEEEEEEERRRMVKKRKRQPARHRARREASAGRRARARGAIVCVIFIAGHKSCHMNTATGITGCP